MRASFKAAATLLVCTICMAPRAGATQPQVGATELARARTLLTLSRAELSAEQFALLSRRLAAAESAYAELTTIARASQAAAAATEGGVAASARAASTGGRALLGGAAELLPLLLLLWPSTAHAPGVNQETPEIQAARKKVEESLEALAQAARQVEGQRAAATARAAGKGVNAAVGAERNTPEQSALIDMAKRDKKTGVTRGDAEAYKELGKTVDVPVRGPEAHPKRPHGKEHHIHVGPVDHIPVKPEGR